MYESSMKPTTQRQQHHSLQAAGVSHLVIPPAAQQHLACCSVQRSNANEGRVVPRTFSHLNHCSSRSSSGSKILLSHPNKQDSTNSPRHLNLAGQQSNHLCRHSSIHQQPAR
jgi:hypothetical protein